MKRDGICSVEIHRFRGVSGSLALDLNADAVIISGANGTGKTTLADAIWWCLTGELPALKQLQSGEPIKEDYVVSAYRRGEKAIVALELQFSGERVRLRRTGNAAASDIEVSSGSETALPLLNAVRDDAALVARWLSGTALLRQGVVEQFLTARSDQRHRELRSLLGLTVLDDFEDAVTFTHDELRKRVAAAVENAATLRQRIEERESRLAVLLEASAEDPLRLATARLEELVLAADGIDAALPTVITAPYVESLGREVGTVLTAAERFVSTIPVTESDPEEAATSVETAEAELREAHAALDRVAQSAPWLQLASVALELLHGPSCPVCDQPIDVDAVRIRLEGWMERSISAAKDVEAAKARVELAGAEVARTAAMLQQAERAREAQAKGEAEWYRVLSRIELLQVERELTPGSGGRLIEALTQLRDGLRRLWLDVRSPAGRTELERLDAELNDLRSEVSEAEVAVERATKRAADAKAVRDAATASCLKVTTTAMEELTPALRVVHDRLAPHPTFREFDLVHKFAHRKGRTSTRVRDPFEGPEANPAMVFSDGQLNALAVAIFSAVALAVPRPPIPFLMLDDPLQALDAPNVLALADLCRELRDRRQLIVTTHDRRFASLLERKLTPRERGTTTRVLRFTGWRPEGPIVESEMLALDIPPHVLDVA